jgi:hypothetical protein
MDKLQELFELALEWFCKGFTEGTHASLHIIGSNAKGERFMLKIAANDDEQMVQNSKDSLSHNQITAFAGIGEGNLPTRNGMVPVFIIYLQSSPGDPVRIMAMPYQRGKKGEISMGKLMDIAQDKSWL